MGKEIAVWKIYVDPQKKITEKKLTLKTNINANSSKLYLYAT